MCWRKLSKILILPKDDNFCAVSIITWHPARIETPRKFSVKSIKPCRSNNTSSGFATSSAFLDMKFVKSVLPHIYGTFFTKTIIDLLTMKELPSMVVDFGKRNS